MKQTTEQIKTTFATLMHENGFQYTGRTSIRIEAHESYGYPIIHIYRDGRLTEQRDYSSPKRAINAIREILRCAGYTL